MTLGEATHQPTVPAGGLLDHLIGELRDHVEARLVEALYPDRRRDE